MVLPNISGLLALQFLFWVCILAWVN